jgi:hypothetical protein
MADTEKIVQSRPSAATLTDLYAPAAGKRFIGQLFVVNETTSSIGARVSLADDGAVDGASQYILGGNVNSASIPGDGFPYALTGIILGTTDKIRVYAVTVGLVFTLNGIERS